MSLILGRVAQLLLALFGVVFLAVGLREKYKGGKK